eukprot:gb/GEZN01001047.1/.p1 GENE.gb/GEZN01001047.1/~~gb/GEZN01001047.1/.p1  ORF type:complete len:803 (-),score=146.07 gb/GEZN01001047.1/:854-3262(-)
MSEKPRPDSPGHMGQKLDGQPLREALKRQLEWYFSQQNLASDYYLTGKMDENKYVPVEVIAGFPKVKALSEDRQIIIEVMKTCNNLALDETASKVKPVAPKKAQRRTLILRDMAEATPEEIRGLFTGEYGKGKITDVKLDFGNSWFVSFETEEQALQTAQAINFGSLLFKDKPVRCAVKSQITPRVYNPAYGPQDGVPGGPARTAQAVQTAAGAAAPPGAGYYPGYGIPGGYYPYAQGYPMAYPQQYMGQIGTGAPVDGQGHYGYMHRGGYRNQNPNQNPSHQQNRRGRQNQNNQNQQSSGGQMVKDLASSPGQPGSVNAGKKKDKSQKRKNKDQAQQKGKDELGKHSPPQLGPSDFPALPTARPPASVAGVAGYAREFRQYDRETIAKVVDTLAEKGFEKPEFPPNCPLIRDQPAPRSHLLEPFPVIYPASPSPELAAQPQHSGPMPYLDLGSMMGGAAPAAQSMSGGTAAGAKPAVVAGAAPAGKKGGKAGKGGVPPQQGGKAGGATGKKQRKNSEKKGDDKQQRQQPQQAGQPVQTTGRGWGSVNHSKKDASKTGRTKNASESKSEDSAVTATSTAGAPAATSASTPDPSTSPKSAAPAASAPTSSPTHSSAASSGGWGGKSAADIVKAAEATAAERAKQQAAAAAASAAAAANKKPPRNSSPSKRLNANPSPREDRHSSRWGPKGGNRDNRDNYHHRRGDDERYGGKRNNDSFNGPGTKPSRGIKQLSRQSKGTAPGGNGKAERSGKADKADLVQNGPGPVEPATPPTNNNPNKVSWAAMAARLKAEAPSAQPAEAQS